MAGAVLPLQGDLSSAWLPSSTSLTGAPITDADCDGVLIRKVGSVYQRRQLPGGVIDATLFGVLPYVDQDNAALLNAFIDGLPTGYGYTICLPRGIVICKTSIVLRDKPILLTCPAEETIVFFPSSCLGIREEGTVGHRIENLTILAASRNDQDGFVNGARSRNGLDYQYHGLFISTVSEVRNVRIGNFSGNGVFISANVGDRSPQYPYGFNASHTKITNVEVRSCGGNAFYTVGSDANSVIFLGCSGRDSGLANFWGDDFLGCHYLGCLAHRANTWNLAGGPGHYMLMNANSYGSVISCYGEGDSPPSQLSGRAVQLGGIHYNGFITSGFALSQQGNEFSSMQFGGLSLGTDNLRLASARSGSYSPLFFLNKDTSGATTNWKLADSEHQNDQGILEVFQAGAAAHGRRAQAQAGLAVQWMYLGDVLHLSMNIHGRNFSFNQDLPVLLNYRPGDVITFADREEAYCKRLICVQAGQGAAAKWMADGDGRGPTNQRPGSSSPNYAFFGTSDSNGDMYVGWGYYDTDKKVKVWWDGAAWRDATGAVR